MAGVANRVAHWVGLDDHLQPDCHACARKLIDGEMPQRAALDPAELGVRHADGMPGRALREPSRDPGLAKLAAGVSADAVRLFPAEMLAHFRPELVAPAALFLVSQDAPTNMIVGAGAGVIQAAYVTLTRGVALGADEQTPEGVAAHWSEIVDRAGEITPQNGAEQAMTILQRLQEA